MAEKKLTAEEKVAALRSKRDNLAQKSKELDAQIAKLEKESHDNDVKELDTVCRKNKLKLSEVTRLVAAITLSDMSVDDVISLVSNDNSPVENLPLGNSQTENVKEEVTNA